MKKLWVIIVVVLVIAVLGYAGRHKIKSMMGGAPTPIPTQAAVAPTTAPSAAMKADEFTVNGTEFKYDVSTITVKKGDTVKITFKNGGTYPHNLTVDTYGATKTLKPGEEDTLTFVADKVGTFAYKCTVDSHAEKGMTGTLTVQ